MNQKQPQQLLQTEACRAGKVELSLFRCDIFQTTGEFHAVSWWQHRAALHNAALCFTALTHPQGTGRGCHAADKERSGRHADHIKVSHRSLNGGSSLHCECSSSAASTAAASQLVGGLLCQSCGFCCHFTKAVIVQRRAKTLLLFGNFFY